MMVLLLIMRLGVVISVCAMSIAIVAANLAIDQTRIITEIAIQLLQHEKTSLTVLSGSN